MNEMWSHIPECLTLMRISIKTHSFGICGVQRTPKTVWSGIKDMQSFEVCRLALFQGSDNYCLRNDQSVLGSVRTPKICMRVKVGGRTNLKNGDLSWGILTVCAIGNVLV